MPRGSEILTYVFFHQMAKLYRKHIDGGYSIKFVDNIIIDSKNIKAQKKHIQVVVKPVW